MKRDGLKFKLLVALTVGACLSLPAIANDCAGAFSQRGLTITVAATGFDDTHNLQCAFLQAANKPGMTVQLGTGTYFTGPVIVKNFYGKFKGEGIGETIIRNPDWPVYVMHDIGCNTWDQDCLPIVPTLGNPFPALFTFMNGDYEVSDLTVQVIGSEATTGWTIVGAEIKGFQYVFMVEGEPNKGLKNANATFRRVEVIGEPSSDYFSSNVWMPIAFGGWFNYEPLSGTLLVTDSKFKGTGTSTTVQNVSNSQILITHNTYDTHIYGPDVSDLKDSSYVFSQNTGKGLALTAWVGASGCDLLLGNCGIVSSSLKFEQNSLEGAVGMSIDGPMDAESTCKIVGNSIFSFGPSFAFGAMSQNCTAVINATDTYDDLGTNNRVGRNGPGK